MTDDRDEFDPSDWLASQFAEDPEPEKPAPPPAEPAAAPPQPPVVPPAVVPPAAQPPVVPPVVVPPAAQPPAVQPSVMPPPFAPPPLAPLPPSAPVDMPPSPQLPPAPPVAPTASGGFAWGLTPSSDAQGSDAQPADPGPAPAPPPQEPAPFVPPPVEPAFVPPLVPPPLEPAPFVPPPLEPPAFVPPAPEPTPYIRPAATFSFDQPTTAFPVEQPTTAFPVEQPTTAFPVDQPTTALPRQELEAQPFDATQWLAAPVDPSLEGVTEVLEAELVGVPAPEGEGLETSAIDSLFGESKFTDYAGQSMIQVPPPRGPREGKPKKERGPLGPLPRNQVILMWVAGGLVAALALVALFLLGTRLGGLSPAPAAVVSPSPSPSASAAFVLGPVAPGEYVWNELLGGECLEPWESAWDDRFTVVDCAKPHAAQMVHKGEFDDPLDAVYPGVEELAKRINLLCTAPTIIDYTLAGSSKDIVVTASFAADADDWDEGNRTFYCFVNRSSGEDLTGSIAMPQVAPTPTPLPTP